jgi:hypothetical protein
MTRRNPLDFSAPRISDLPAPDVRKALFAREQRAREAWLRNRQHRPLVERMLNLFRGAPPARGRGDGGHQLPSAVATDHVSRAVPSLSREIG